MREIISFIPIRSLAPSTQEPIKQENGIDREKREGGEEKPPPPDFPLCHFIRPCTFAGVSLSLEYNRSKHAIDPARIRKGETS